MSEPLKTKRRVPGARLVPGLLALLSLAQLTAPGTLIGQDAATADTVQEAPARVEDEGGGRPPAFFTIGVGYGLRQDDCVLCVSPEDDQSFTAHVGVGKYLAGGLGVGIDASVWRRTRQRALAAPDTTGPAAATSLSNMLGNASLSVSYHLWHMFAHVGGGVAWGHQDLEETSESGQTTITRVSGIGVGYTLGSGVTVPVYNAISIAIFGNWNVGYYDMSAPGEVVVRGAQHRFYEVGVGITIQ